MIPEMLEDKLMSLIDGADGMLRDELEREVRQFVRTYCRRAACGCGELLTPTDGANCRTCADGLEACQ